MKVLYINSIWDNYEETDAKRIKEEILQMEYILKTENTLILADKLAEKIEKKYGELTVCNMQEFIDSSYCESECFGYLGVNFELSILSELLAEDVENWINQNINNSSELLNIDNKINELVKNNCMIYVRNKIKEQLINMKEEGYPIDYLEGLIERVKECE